MQKFRIGKYTIPVKVEQITTSATGNDGNGTSITGNVGNPMSLNETRIARCCVIADLHDHSFGSDNQVLLEKIREQRPDFVLSTGDLLTAKHGKFRLANAQALAAALAKEFPFYLVNGNHEERLKTHLDDFGDAYSLYAKELKTAGVHFLNNRTEEISFGGITFALTGYEVPLEDYSRVHKVKSAAESIRKALKAVDKEGTDTRGTVTSGSETDMDAQPNRNDGTYRILLCHHPDLFEACADFGADLVLSGHNHGGMVRLPLLGGVIGSTLMPFPRYSKGLYEKGKSKMIVSAGLGAHTIPVRINNPRELVVIDFEEERAR